MKIGIDLDGVTADFMTPYVDHYNSINGTSFVYEDLIEHDYWNVFGISKEEGFESVFRYMKESDFKEVLPIEGAIGSLKKLAKKHELVVVTSRPELYKEKTLQWIDHHLPGIFKEIFFTFDFASDGGQVRKQAICEKEKIDILIEDYSKNIFACSNSCKKIIVLDQPWNKNIVLPENAVRVKNWEEVLGEIDEIKF